MDWYFKVLKTTLDLVAVRRKEYWMFVLVNLVLTGVVGIIDKMLGWERAGGEGILTMIYGLLVFCPWAVQFRRPRHRSFGVVAAVAVNPACRLAGDSDL